VAIEKREPGEEKIEGPSIEELVAKETVDSLPYVGWQEEKKEVPVAPVKTRTEHLANAKLALSQENYDGTIVLHADAHASLSDTLLCLVSG
jgi:hypothetical protein